MSHTVSQFYPFEYEMILKSKVDIDPSLHPERDTGLGRKRPYGAQSTLFEPLPSRLFASYFLSRSVPMNSSLEYELGGTQLIRSPSSNSPRLWLPSHPACHLYSLPPFLNHPSFFIPPLFHLSLPFNSVEDSPATTVVWLGVHHHAPHSFDVWNLYRHR